MLVDARTIPALVSRDESKVLALGLGTLSNTAAHSSLEFVRRADALVTLFEVNGHFADVSYGTYAWSGMLTADRIANAITTPAGANARLDSSQRFT